MNSPLAEQMIYVEHMTVQPIEVTLSFASAASANAVPDLNAMPRWTWLSELEEAQLRLQRLEMHNPLLRANALVALVNRLDDHAAPWDAIETALLSGSVSTTCRGSQISQHYSREIFPTVLRLVGSIGIMGDPLRNLQYLGLGVLQFVAGPASGFVQSVRGHGPRRFAQGVAEGTDALFRNVIFAASNATSKFSSAARKVCWRVLHRTDPSCSWKLVCGMSHRQGQAASWRPIAIYAPVFTMQGLTNLGIASTSLERDPGNLPEAASASLLSGVMRGIAGLAHTCRKPVSSSALFNASALPLGHPHRRPAPLRP